MIWGSMCIYGPGFVCINQHFYYEILKQNVCRTIQKFHLDPSHVILQQDNGHVHATQMLQEWFSMQCVSLPPWSTQSPHLNPIEHPWAILN